jgi:8-oxo-dGTP diphosphatase
MTGGAAPLRGAAPNAAVGAPIDVAVGVVARGDGAVLLGQRVAGKPYAGWWEFPGGKLEAGESVERALARELHEELGLDVVSSRPWVVREFVYPHARVRLHFRRVSDFRGEPASREGQAFVWRPPDRIDVAPLLPATVPVIGWLRLPTMCLLSGIGASGEERGLHALASALERAQAASSARSSVAPIVVLAEPTLEAQRFERLFYRIRSACSARGARLLVSDGHPPSFARAADGVVVRAASLATHTRRPSAAIAAARCANPEDLVAAARLGFDFALADDRCLPALARGAPLPVLLDVSADGAATGASVDAAQDAGAHGIAVPPRLWQDAASGE